MPQDYQDQSDYCNMAVAGMYSGSPEALLETIQIIENRYGRDRSRDIRIGPRTLDIDILLFGSSVLSTGSLVVPHERMNRRQFALIPLLELLPECIEPGTGIPYRDLLEKLPDQGVKKVGNVYGY